MIGRSFVRYLKPQPPRHLTRLSLFLGFLQQRVNLAISRAEYVTPNGYGSRKLIEMIKLADIKTVLDMDARGKDWVPYVSGMLSDIEQPIDPKHSRRGGRIFIRSRMPCFEIMMPVRSGLPPSAPYTDPLWNSIRPLRVVDMGTCDINVSFQSDYLVYPKHAPAYAVYTVDALALVGKFVAYYKSRKDTRDFDQVLLDYLHTEVIVPQLINDTVSIWLRNIYKHQFLQGSPLETLVGTIWDAISLDSVSIDLKGALFDVQHLKNDLNRQALTPQTVLNSLPLTLSGQSFTGFYHELINTTKAPPSYPLWTECLKYLSYWEFVVLVASHASTEPDVISMQRDLIRDVRIALMAKPWAGISDSLPYKTMVKHRIEGLYQYLNYL